METIGVRFGILTLGSFAFGWLFVDTYEELKLEILLGFFGIRIIYGGADDED